MLCYAVKCIVNGEETPKFARSLGISSSCRSAEEDQATAVGNSHKNW